MKSRGPAGRLSTGPHARLLRFPAIGLETIRTSFVARLVPQLSHLTSTTAFHFSPHMLSFLPQQYSMPMPSFSSSQGSSSDGLNVSRAFRGSGRMSIGRLISGRAQRRKSGMMSTAVCSRRPPCLWPNTRRIWSSCCFDFKSSRMKAQLRFAQSRN
jgi:hypothetical protein